ncbi:hypothetical protein NYO98_01935 [Nocardioides sp. STR2]|uniref:Lipoprotein n=1 Tax=Nocardioides pini TaxID=2975053 RepID=A0ABT4C9G4_9ACTN|nr:hypothetical protein [Nocardioides pini]MCY4725021.1 hypothetical protein [Nocardioides pini]
MSRPTTRGRTALLLPAAMAALALTLGGCASDDDAATSEPTAGETPSETPSASGSASDGTLALTADDSAAGKCAMPSAEVLSTFDTAFEGTVTSVEGGTATLEVDQWYAGGDASTVTVEAPSKALEDLLLAVDFQEGQTYLVSADGDRVTLCGFTAETTPELEALYAEAFPAEG